MAGPQECVAATEGHRRHFHYFREFADKSGAESQFFAGRCFVVSVLPLMIVSQHAALNACFSLSTAIRFFSFIDRQSVEPSVQ